MTKKQLEKYAEVNGYDTVYDFVEMTQSSLIYDIDPKVIKDSESYEHNRYFKNFYSKLGRDFCDRMVDETYKDICESEMIDNAYQDYEGVTYKQIIWWDDKVNY